MKYFYYNEPIKSNSYDMSFTETEQQDWEDRVVLICKPEQSGKTEIMIKQIINDLLEEPTEGKNVINFIFCANNLLLAKQTSSRVQGDLTKHHENEKEHYGEVEGETICQGESIAVEESSGGEESSGEEETATKKEKTFYVEFSTRRGAKKDPEGIGYSITGPAEIRNIVCCANKTRVNQISNIIDEFNKSPKFRSQFEFNIWMDEADIFTKFIDQTFRPLVRKNSNIHLYLLTATPKTLFDKYGELNVFPLEFTTNETKYHGWNDNDKVILENSKGTTEGFIEHVLTNVVSEPPTPGSKWYIPASTKKRTHEHVRNILVEKNFAVFVVNGDGLALSIPDGELICEKKTEELNTQLLRMYEEKDLSRFPVAVTGNICVGRGISIMSPEFIFDYGILSNCSKKSEASQNAGRLKGNMKDWPEYRPPTVFTTAKFDKIATEWEEKSRRLATLAFEKKEEGDGTIITKPEFKVIGDQHGELIIEKFYGEEGEQKGINWFNTHLKKLLPQGKRGPNKTKKNRDGFYIRPIGKGPDRKDVCSTDKRLKYQRWNLDADSKKGRTQYTWFPCYEDVNDPKTLQWWLIYYK